MDPFFKHSEHVHLLERLRDARNEIDKLRYQLEEREKDSPFLKIESIEREAVSIRSMNRRYSLLYLIIGLLTMLFKILFLNNGVGSKLSNPTNYFLLTTPVLLFAFFFLYQHVKLQKLSNTHINNLQENLQKKLPVIENINTIQKENSEIVSRFLARNERELEHLLSTSRHFFSDARDYFGEVETRGGLNNLLIRILENSLAQNSNNHLLEELSDNIENNNNSLAKIILPTYNLPSRFFQSGINLLRLKIHKNYYATELVDLLNATIDLYNVYQLIIETSDEGLKELFINNEYKLDNLINDSKKILKPRDKLYIHKIAISSPGFIEFLGRANPITQIRLLIKDLHQQKMDKKRREILNEDLKNKVEFDDIVKKTEYVLKIAPKLEKLGFSSEEVKVFIKGGLANALNLLDNSEITEAEVIDEEESKTNTETSDSDDELFD